MNLPVDEFLKIYLREEHHFQDDPKFRVTTLAVIADFLRRSTIAGLVDCGNACACLRY